MNRANRSNRPRGRAMEEAEEPVVNQPLTISMMISEWAYRPILLIDRGIRRAEKATRPHRFLARILLGGCAPRFIFNASFSA